MWFLIQLLWGHFPKLLCLSFVIFFLQFSMAVMFTLLAKFYFAPLKRVSLHYYPQNCSFSLFPIISHSCLLFPTLFYFSVFSTFFHFFSFFFALCLSFLLLPSLFYSFPFFFTLSHSFLLFPTLFTLFYAFLSFFTLFYPFLLFFILFYSFLSFFTLLYFSPLYFLLPILF